MAAIESSSGGGNTGPSGGSSSGSSGGTGSGGTSGGSGSIQTTIAKRAITFDAQAQPMPESQLSNGSSISFWSGAGYYLRGAGKSIVNTVSGIGNLLAISQPGSLRQLQFAMAISHPRHLWNAIRSENERNAARAASDPRFCWEQQGQTDMTALLLLAPYADILKALGIAGDAARAGMAAKDAGELLQAGTKSEALSNLGKLPENIQSSIKSFFKKATATCTDFTVSKESNGNYIVSMMKPGNVPGSKAIYYTEISPDGELIKVYKDTFDPSGNLVHSKTKY